MGRWLKWGAGVFAVLFAVVVLLGGLAWLLALRSVPDRSGEIAMTGLSAPVAVERDRHGVPYIRAATHADAVQALGFAHAQDRLWHMHTLRMTAQGRLSELFGEPTIEIDKFLRTLEFRRRSDEGVASASDRDRALLEAYARGVNAHLETVDGASLPPEFLILGVPMEPWRPRDTMAILKLMSLQLSQNMTREIDRLKLAAAGLSPSEIGDIVPTHPEDRLPPLPNLGALLNLTPPVAKDETSAAVDIPMGRFASNNWVLAGDRTTTGKPILANDPHLAFSTPSLWYLAALSWGDGRSATGATIPGVGAVVLGHNGRLAWGFTNAGGDVQDLFIERTDALQPDRYLTPDGWATFEEVDETITVSGGEPVRWTWRRSRHGPVLPEGFRDVGKLLPTGHVMALNWVALRDDVPDPSFANLVELNLAPGVDAALSNLDDTATPQQAAVFADVDGRIGFAAPGVLPVRGDGDDTAGRQPKLGWLPGGDWKGLVRGPQLHRKAADTGAFGNANSRFPEQNADPFYTADWDETFRQQRVKERYLSQSGPFDLQMAAAGQTDDASAAMSALRDAVLRLAGTKDTRSGLLDRLRRWDGTMAAHAPEPLIMTDLTLRLARAIFRDELKGAFDAILGRPATPLLRVLNEGGSRDWCDDIATALPEDCAVAVRRALEETDRLLSERFGTNPATWRWDSVHRHFGQHRPFSNVPGLNRLFEVNQPTGGGAYTLRRAKTSLKDEDIYRAVHGAGFRAVYDLADLDRSLFVQTTGQSGHPLSPHFSDLAPLWGRGDYITLPGGPVDPQGVWQLTPAGQ